MSTRRTLPLTQNPPFLVPRGGSPVFSNKAKSTRRRRGSLCLGLLALEPEQAYGNVLQEPLTSGAMSYSLRRYVNEAPAPAQLIRLATELSCVHIARV